MNKYLIVNSDDKYCKKCGRKRSVSLSSYFDPATGKQFAYLKCFYKDCYWYAGMERDRKAEILIVFLLIVWIVVLAQFFI